jgi:hypothetical protein
VNAKSSTSVCRRIISINVYRGFVDYLDLYDILMISIYTLPLLPRREGLLRKIARRLCNGGHFRRNESLLVLVQSVLLEDMIVQQNVVNAIIAAIPSSDLIPISVHVAAENSKKNRESKLLHSLRFLVTFECSRDYSNARKQIIWSAPHGIAAYWRGE